jgi:hypothetical protein
MNKLFELELMSKLLLSTSIVSLGQCNVSLEIFGIKLSMKQQAVCAKLTVADYPPLGPRTVRRLNFGHNIESVQF